jgi:hypothetical protein
MIRTPPALQGRAGGQAGWLACGSAIACVITRDFGVRVLIPWLSDASGPDFRTEKPNLRRN